MYLSKYIIKKKSMMVIYKTHLIIILIAFLTSVYFENFKPMAMKILTQSCDWNCKHYFLIYLNVLKYFDAGKYGVSLT